MPQENPKFFQPQPFLHPFPDADSVFAPAENNQGVTPAQAAHMLLPLLSIDLSAVNPEWDGRIHMLSLLEYGDVCDGYFAEDMEEFHSYYTRPNWIGFHLNKHSRYSLAGDWRCFRAMSENKAVCEAPEVRKAYSEGHQYFAQNRAFYAQNRALPYTLGCEKDDDYFKGREVLSQWSAGRIMPDSGNWEGSGDFPLDWVTTPDDRENWLCPITEDGRSFVYIGSARGYEYHKGGPGRIVLFYDPVTRIALQTFDWS